MSYLSILNHEQLPDDVVDECMEYIEKNIRKAAKYGADELTVGLDVVFDHYDLEIKEQVRIAKEVEKQLLGLGYQVDERDMYMLTVLNIDWSYPKKQ